MQVSAREPGWQTPEFLLATPSLVLHSSQSLIVTQNHLGRLAGGFTSLKLIGAMADDAGHSQLLALEAATLEDVGQYGQCSLEDKARVQKLSLAIQDKLSRIRALTRDLELEVEELDRWAGAASRAGAVEVLPLPPPPRRCLPPIHLTTPLPFALQRRGAAGRGRAACAAQGRVRAHPVCLQAGSAGTAHHRAALRGR